MSQSVKFCVFADFHYMKQCYPVTQEHLDRVLRRARDNDVDFVVQLGDFCNDFTGSATCSTWSYINHLS
jgi:predicted phosphodiesterase